MRSIGIIIAAALLISGSLAVSFNHGHFKGASAVTQATLGQLDKTNLGKLGKQLLQLQIETNGPLDELQTSFEQLKKDIEFKRNWEMREYRMKLIDHIEFKRQIQKRITENKNDVTLLKYRIMNKLAPAKKQLDYDHKEAKKNFARTLKNINTESSERKTEVKDSKVKHTLFVDQIAAVKDCINYLQFIIDEDLYVKPPKIRGKLNKVNALLKKSSYEDPLSQMFVELARSFSKKSDVKKVIKLLKQFLKQHTESYDDFVFSEKAAATAFKKMMGQYESDLKQLKSTIARQKKDVAALGTELKEARGELIQEKKELKDAKDDMAEEEKRWTREKDSHKDIIAEMNDELEAIQTCIDLFSVTELSSNGISIQQKSLNIH